MGLKIKYDSRKVDRSKSVGVPPNPGVYLMTIKGVKFRKDNNDIELMLRVKTGDHKGYGFWRYISLDPSSDWKLDQAQLAIGMDTINKPTGSFDIDDFLNKDVMGRVKHGTYNGDYRPELAGLLPVPADFDEEDGDDEDEDEEGDEDESEDDEDEDEDDEDLDLEQLGADADEEDEDAINTLTRLAENAVLDPDDFDTWAELAEALGEADEEEDEEEDEPPAKATKKAAPKASAKSKKSYEDMDLDDLKAECTKRGLQVKGSKSAIIARLRANDDDPFSE